MTSHAPLILTVKMEEAAHEHFTALRTRYFPKHCNYLEAHLTLFHRLPSDKDLIHQTLLSISKRPVMELKIDAVKSIGNGVAYQVISPELLTLHTTLQQKWAGNLIARDRQPLWPHITVQNKVTAFKAAQTLHLLQKDFSPFSIKGMGISSWLYRNGPWQKLHDYLFTEA
ncbi:MAG: 2'-5' RNA ligase family protein [Ferruginibacter sp.]